jgi:hypothetical protein
LPRHHGEVEHQQTPKLRSKETMLIYAGAHTLVVDVAKAMKRTEAAVRQKAKTIEIGLGHRR